MPTADRRAYVPWAVEYFLAQRYPNKELVVLDDGQDTVRDLIPECPEIRYFRDTQRRILGDKRNRLCELSHGELVAHWDDDDWQSPERLSYQVQALLDAGAEVCGITRPLFLEQGGQRAWEYVYPAQQQPWLSGSSLCYRRRTALAHPFPSIAIGEDAHFVRRLDPARVLVLDRCDFHVGIIHRCNASPKRTGSSRWRAFDVQRLATLMGVAAERYGVMPDPATTTRAPEPAVAAGRALVATAYGIGDILRATPLVRALRWMGYVVDFLVAPDFPETAALVDDRRYVNRTLCYPDFRSNKGEASLPALEGVHYDIALYSHWAGPLDRQVSARQSLHTAADDWLRLGDSECYRRLACSLGWHGELPAAFC
ncbi:MAG: glycosyltransferase family 2 protein, partial [Gammaproteobacteria bacterium]|nr:glycosyltransferase family 2 protein [Gammaproteobacteria bacterium]